MSHAGINLRITTPHGPVVNLDSDSLHYIAKIGGGQGWHEVFPGQNMTWNGSRDLVVEIQPVMLSDEPYPED